jgi:serine/threonine-protein kinase
MQEEWVKNWEPIPGTSGKSGGQGSVVKVRRRTDQVVGALKCIHEKDLNNTERRYRMRQEVDALRLLSGQGTPIVYEANDEQWEAKGRPLYLVTQWIEGPNLSDLLRSGPISLDSALSITVRLLETLDRFHNTNIVHRDLKPDNIIIEQSDPQRPYIVDFGMSWTRPEEGQEQDFSTGPGQEIGNRFLRLPEYAPGRDHRDERSDLSMIVGVLLYMITGQAPRVLLDEQGRMPHESLADKVPSGVKGDPRWGRLRRVFHIGFQQDLAMRFQSAQQLQGYLANLSPASKNESALKELEELQALMQSDLSRKHQALVSNMLSTSHRFLNFMNKKLAGSGTACGGQGPTYFGESQGVEIRFFIQRSDMIHPQSHFIHFIRVLGNEYVAGYQVDGGTVIPYGSSGVSGR